MIRTILLVLVTVTIFSSTFAQDFYGADFTGLHTVGAYVKYDGNISTGLQYNYRKFNGPWSRPLNLNINAGLGIDNGISNVETKISTYQIYADGGYDFQKSFGLGTSLDFEMNYCLRDENMGKTDDLKDPCDVNFEIGLSLRPGYYANNAAITGVVHADIIRFSLGDNRINLDESNKLEVRAFQEFEVGAHLDWVNRFGKSLHVTYDIAQTIRLNEEDPNNSEFYEEMKRNLLKNGVANCAVPAWNLQMRASLAASF